LFDQIKTWEKDLFTQKITQEREAHLGNLKSELENLESKKAKLPTRNINKNKIWRFNSDIDQIKWRLRYLQAAESGLAVAGDK
jgi:hypothetical protein